MRKSTSHKLKKYIQYNINNAENNKRRDFYFSGDEMLIVFKKFALTHVSLKIAGATLSLILSFSLIVGHIIADSAKKAALEDSIGGPDIAVTAEEASQETGGSTEPEELNLPKMLLFSTYTVQEGDALEIVAKKHGLATSTLVSVNNIKNTRLLKIGKELRVPNQDGVFYVVKKGDTLSGIATKHKITEANKILVANELFSESINPNTSLFIPGATLPWEEERVVVTVERTGSQDRITSADLFAWPIRGRLTSYYGYRRNPITGRRAFHDGLDIAAVNGTPIKAAMDGRVQSVGYDNVYGNFVIISHADGYRTLYGHMDSTATRSGAYVDTETVIGYVGNTGQSTGDHLHFTVYRNGVSINPRSVLLR
jgi:murein DD-endopeptidase MepM/ murein hydrolase activator NlpD